MDKKEIRFIIAKLKKAYPDSKCALHFSNTFELLVAVILSAQCTDKRVNIITEKLFKKYSRIEDYAQATQKAFEKDIHSAGFYRNKAKNIRETARIILEKYRGEVPATFQDLIELPGVARKTANVVMFHGFGIASGIAVDTHVTRITRLLGMTRFSNPVQIERDLQEKVPQKDWGMFTNLIIDHGRKVCVARRPQCDVCVLQNQCAYVLNKRKVKKV